MADRFKQLLTRLGEYASAGTIHRLNATVNYLEVGRWMRERGLRTTARVARRELIFDKIAAEIGDRTALYVEFGVWRGASMRHWASALRSPTTKLHGFDSFEGLPEAWVLNNGRGHFSVDGNLPEIDDARVRFFRGWFSDTLATYEPPPHDVLVINVDCDLYSSTKTVLDRFADLVVPGTYIYFDEFSDRNHELRAFDEYLTAHPMKLRVVGATKTLAHVAFQRES